MIIVQDWIEFLNDKQKEAVSHSSGPLLVLAGAGSGKTRVIAYRIAYLIERCSLSPFRILAVTFTNKAADEMKQRVEGLLRQPIKGMWIGTFHAIAARILRRECPNGLKSNFLILDEGEQEQLLRQCLRENSSLKSLGSTPSLRESISFLKNKLVYPEEYVSLASTERDRQFAHLYLRYQEQLQANNALDFDDLLAFTVMLFRQDAETLNKYRQSFQHVLVDEFQDINYPQYELVKLLAWEHRNIFVVGDDYQAIYSWRGADVHFMLEKLEEDFPELRIIRLERNYRSGQTILDAANEVISRIAKGKDKRLWSDQPDEQPALVRITAFDPPDEARLIVREMERLVREEGKNWRDFAVLYRTNSQSRVLEEVLMTRGIPFRVYGGLRFYERKEIKDAISLLGFLVNPRSNVHLQRVLTWMKGIGQTTLERAQEMGTSLWEGLLLLEERDLLKGKAKQTMAKLKELNEFFSSSREEYDIFSLLKELLERSNYLDQLKEEGTLEAQNRLENLQELMALARELEEETSGLTPEEFLSHLSLYTDLDTMDSQADSVTLMTVHSAKGLEFPYIFIVGLEEGVFPHWRASSPDELDEERRLCYVAITRAQKRVYFSWSRVRYAFGGRQENEPSRFLAEIPDHYFANTQDGDSSKGKRIRHQAWGEGVILSEEEKGPDTIIEVYFPSVGKKRLILRYAPVVFLED